MGGPVGYYNGLGKLGMGLQRRSKKKFADAAAQDPAWNNEMLINRVKDVFKTFQADWSNFNTANFKTYMTADYARHNELMMLALRQRQRRNDVQSPRIYNVYPVQVEDEPDNSKDTVTFLVHAKAHDVLLETVEGQQKELFTDDNDFYEYWRFARQGNDWLLDKITQATQDNSMLRAEVMKFADDNGLYYDADWGWLLLPSRGQLFGKGKFGTSDINNHTIGLYKNLLVELYTYEPKPGNRSTNTGQYLIAQTALPKRYDSLIVEAKQNALATFFRRTPKGYNKLSLEWPDFNKRYTVFATNVEQVTAFELLHPVYMEKLFALPFKVSIEVVDNVVYLYTTDKKADYVTMYGLLKDAFEEMKL